MTTNQTDTIAMNVAANIHDREYAQEIFDLCGEQRERFWECLKALCESKLPAPPPVVERLPAMTESEATHFESERMPYGNHYGTAVGEVPCDYLLFLTEGDGFSKKIRRYVKSKRFAERQGDE
jgi:hypothetical protein